MPNIIIEKVSPIDTTLPITVTELRGILSDTAIEDSFLEQLILAAIERAEGYCGVPLREQRVKVYLPCFPSGKGELELPFYFDSISSAFTLSDGSSLSSFNLFKSQFKSIIKPNVDWPSGSDDIMVSIEGKSGYSNTALPSDIRQAYSELIYQDYSIFNPIVREGVQIIVGKQIPASLKKYKNYQV